MNLDDLEKVKKCTKLELDLLTFRSNFHLEVLAVSCVRILAYVGVRIRLCVQGQGALFIPVRSSGSGSSGVFVFR